MKRPAADRTNVQPSRRLDASDGIATRSLDWGKLSTNDFREREARMLRKIQDEASSPHGLFFEVISDEG